MKEYLSRTTGVSPGKIWIPMREVCYWRMLKKLSLVEVAVSGKLIAVTLH